MKPSGAPVPPKMPIAVTCSCGRQIVLEPHGVGKPTTCSGCRRKFTVRMLFDPQTRRWSPHVNFMPTAAGPGTAPPAPQAWVTVACRCGHKIGLDSRFLGRTMTCTACHRQFTVKMVDAGEGHDTAIIRYSRDAAPTPLPGLAPKADLRKRAETARGKAVTHPAEEASPPMEPAPNEMHLLCTCGEELTVEKKYFNDKLCCGGCGTVMQLRLIFVPDRAKYELEARVVDPKE